MAGAMGPRAGGNRFPNLLLTRDPEWQARCAIKAFGVLPREGGGGKPVDHDGSAGKKPRREKPGRKKRHFVRLLLSPVVITPGKEMGGGIPGKCQKGGKGG